MLLALSVLAQGSDNVAYLSSGWDTNGPLSMGKVSWNDQSSGFSVTFELQGAKPNHYYTIGAHFFDSNDLTESPNINKFIGWYVDKGTINREGTTAATEAWDFGYLKTDQSGNGKREINGYVPDGSYYAQFTVRSGSGCHPDKGQSDGCDVVYRTGNGFANGLEKIAIGGYKEEGEVRGKGETSGSRTNK